MPRSPNAAGRLALRGLTRPAMEQRRRRVGCNGCCGGVFQRLALWHWARLLRSTNWTIILALPPSRGRLILKHQWRLIIHCPVRIAGNRTYHSGWGSVISLPGAGKRGSRASLDWTAEDGCPHISRTLRPVGAVETAVLDGFGDVFGFDGRQSFDVSDGAGYFEDAVVGAGA
jgi:hypothetical protein